MLNRDLVEQFIAVSYLYFLTTDKTSADISPFELEELIVAINDSNERMAGQACYLA